MTNQEQTLLQAISDMMDEKLEKRLDEVFERKLDEILERKLDEVLERKLDEVLERKLDEVLERKLDEVLERKLDEILERKLDEILDKKLDKILDKKLDEKLEVALKPIKEELADLNRRVGRLEVTQDTVILPLLREISSCYLDTYKRYQRDADRMEQAFEDIDLLKKTVEKHSAILQNSFA